MKIKRFVVSGFLILLFSISKSYAQTFVDVSRLTLINPGNLSTGLAVGQNTAKCIQVFGKPTRITKHYSEIDDETFQVYNYAGNKLTFSNSKLIAFEITHSSILVGTINGQTFKVSDKMTSENDQAAVNHTEHRWTFLDFPVSMAAGNARGKNFRAISLVYMKNGATNLDSRLELLFDHNNELFAISLLN